MFWVEFPQFLFLGKPPYVRYLCRSLVVPCRAVEFCPVFAVPEGNDFGSVSGLPTILLEQIQTPCWIAIYFPQSALTTVALTCQAGLLTWQR